MDPVLMRMAFPRSNNHGLLGSNVYILPAEVDANLPWEFADQAITVGAPLKPIAVHET